MQINNLTIPDAGVTTQIIPDPIGGWIYRVTTVVSVEQQKLDAFRAEVEAAQTALADAQAKVDSLTVTSTEVEAAFAAATPVEVTPVVTEPPVI